MLFVNPPPGTTPHAIQLRSLAVEPVTSFPYLGSEINESLNLEATGQDRLAKANAVFAQRRRIWAGHMPLRLKSRMYHALVRPVALYGAEAWTLLPAHESAIDAAEMWWLRQILGVSPLDHVHNADIRAQTRSPVSLSEVCRQYRLRY